MEKVLHVIGNLDIGGAQSSLYNIWPALATSKIYHVEFCALNALGRYGQLLQSEGAVVHNMGFKERISLEMINRLHQLVDRNNYSIVHVHLFPELYLAPLAIHSLQREIPLIYTEHSANNRRRKILFPFWFLDKLAYSRYKKIVAVGNSTFENLRIWQPGLSPKMVRIPNSVRRPKSLDKNIARMKILSELGLSQPNNKLLILFAGRLTYPKGCDLLIEALSRQELPDYLCLIAGDGPDKPALINMVNHKELGDKIRFLGFRSDVNFLLSGVDLLVVPSRWEGLPMIVLEAMAAQCPIVASAVDGTKELVQDCISAILVPPMNPDLLSQAIRKMLVDPQLRNEFAKQSSLKVENYSPHIVASKLFEIYDYVLEK